MIESVTDWARIDRKEMNKQSKTLELLRRRRKSAETKKMQETQLFGNILFCSYGENQNVSFCNRYWYGLYKVSHEEQNVETQPVSKF